jgi:DNA-binding NtrC family response regulator
MNPRILVVDDTPFVCRQLAAVLELKGYDVEAAGDGRTALELLRARPFQLVITDFHMPEMDGMVLLATIRAEGLPVGVILLTGFGDSHVALDAMKAGADDFVTKPFDPVRLRYLVDRVIERRALMDELDQLRQRVRAEHGFHNLVSKSPAMLRIFELVEQIGPLGSTVLIQGETGTGKDLVAQAIHAASGRRDRPWIAVNCAALAPSLLESELFGHERGAFTGADRRRQGRFELADGGTLFLDEVADLPAAVQAKLLRVLQTGRFERLGGTQTLDVDVRIVAATNKRVEDEVKAGRFRADLFYRLNVIRIDVPPLRERKDDIPLLAAHFLNRLRSRSVPPVNQIDPSAMQALFDHRWPGNVRELENAIHAAVAMAEGSVIHRAALPASIASGAPRTAIPESPIDIERPLRDVTDELLRRVECAYFAQLLARYNGNVARCARHSGLSRRSVTQKLQKYALDRLEFKLPGRRLAADEHEP